MKTSDKRLLSHLVAAYEVAFEPFRWKAPEDTAILAAIVERRAAILGPAGMPWTFGGDGTNRQQGYLALKRLQAAKLIRIHQGKSVQRRGISIIALDAALSVTPNPLVAEAWPQLEQLAAAEDNPESLRSGDYIIEHDVVGLDRSSTDGRPTSDFITAAMPLLMAHLIETWSDTRGLLGWRTTKAGRKAVEMGPPEPGGLLEYDSSLADEYNDLVERGLEDRRTWTPKPGHLGIPLSAGLWMSAPKWEEYRQARIERSASARVPAGDAHKRDA